jgi:hypothetical protein
MLARITERNGRTTQGRLLYSYSYPHAFVDKNGDIKRFERRPQRCAVLTKEGRVWHFTMPAKVEVIA